MQRSARPSKYGFFVVAMLTVGCCGFGGNWERDNDEDDDFGSWQENDWDCQSDNECPVGCYCDDGACVETAACASDGDCASLQLVCDEDRATCVPGEDPGEPACEVDSDCGTGEQCRDGTCEALGPTDEEMCAFDGQCGGGLCEDGMCHAACDSDDDCGTGDTCQENVCRIDDDPTIECVFNSDCGDDGLFTCINGTCHGNCSIDSDCADPDDFCDHEVCRPDWRPTSDCASNSDCDAGLYCVDGQCRTACWDDLGCPVSESCINGFCESA